MRTPQLWIAAAGFALALTATPSRALSAQPGKWDYAYAAGLRTEPFGGRLWGELGYNYLLWGAAPGSGNPYYGYVRPKVSAQTSGKVNRADVGIDFAFWAPLVFEVTYAWDHRSGDFPQFNCSVMQCRGLLTRTKVAAKVTLGYDDYFLLWDSRMEQVKGPDSPVRDFGDHAWSLAGKYPKDTILASELTLGRRLNEIYSVGVRGERAMFQESKENYTTALGFVAMRYPSGLNYFVGAGYYESSRANPGFTTSFGLSWIPEKSFSIR
jgi:hypothetical protein